MNPDSMTPVDWATLPLKKFADFSGRAPRAEYWWFYLSVILFSILANIVDIIIGSDFAGPGYGIFTLILLVGLIIPSVSVAVRRLHDTDHSGWWLLIAFVPIIGVIILLVFLVTPGTLGDNRFGLNPYGEGEGSAVAAQ